MPGDATPRTPHVPDAATRYREAAVATFSRGRERWRRLPGPLRWLGYLLALLFVLWAILFITKGRFLKGPVTGMATRMLNRTVTVGGDFQLYFAPFSIKFLAEKIKIDNVPWASRNALFSADLVDARISTLGLMLGRRDIKWLALRNSGVDLEWSADGKTNSWTLGDPNKPPQPLNLPLIRRANVTGTTLRYRDPRLFLGVDIKVDTVEARDTRFARAISFTGAGTMRKRPFTLAGSLLSPDETVSDGRNPLRANAQSGDTRMTVSGTLPGATQLEGADLAVGARGPNLSLLFDFLGVAIPDSRAYRLASQLTYESGAWRFTRVKGVIGSSDVAGKMTISMPTDRLKIDADMSTQSLDMIDVGPFVGYSPQKLDAQGAKGVVERVNGAPRILPDAPLRIEAIRRFDADVRYKVKSIVQKNVPISNIALQLSLDRARLKLSPLTFDMAGGHLSSDIDINARVTPVKTSYDIRLSPTPMGKLLARWGVAENGTTGTVKARIQMTGAGDTVRKSLATSNGRIAVILPRGAMWARNIQLSELDIGVFIQKMFEKKLKEPVQINCGLIAFTVRNGVAAADPILIDTQKNVILGRGGFSFKDESLDLAMRADGKKFSLFSAQSPIAVNGYFAAPDINPISPQLLARAGVSLGLGVIATPLAAVLAFVDVGDAQSAACGPVLKGSTARAQRTTKGKARDDVGTGTTAKANRN